MKALTLTQPWATLVILGIKANETRSWYPRIRGGRIAIHAAKGWHREDREFADDLHARGILPVASADLPRAAVLGTVRLDGLARTSVARQWPETTELEIELGDYSDGRYAWVFGDPQPFPDPIEARGALGLWDWSDAA